MFIKSRLASTLLLVTAVQSHVSHAEMGTIQLENGIDLTPTLKLDYWQNDNLLFAQDDELDSGQSLITTSLLAELKRGRTEFAFDYEGRWGNAQDSSIDRYDDHLLQLRIDTVPSESSELTSRIYYSRLHEPRGQGISQGFGVTLPEPIEYVDKGGELGWVLSFLSERFWLDTLIALQATEYQNATELTSGLDRDNFTSQLALHMETGSGSSVFLQGRYTKIDYDDGQSGGISRDGDDYRALIGMRWQRGELGAGSIGVGYQDKRFESDLRQDFTGLSWEVGLEWNPVERVNLGFDSSRASVEPPLNGDYIRQINHGLRIDYEFTDRLSFTTNIQYLDQKYVGVERDEETTTYGGELSYEFRSNILFALNFTRQEKIQVWTVFHLTKT